MHCRDWGRSESAAGIEGLHRDRLVPTLNIIVYSKTTTSMEDRVERRIEEGDAESGTGVGAILRLVLDL